MSQRIDHFNEELRLKLTNAENNLHDLKRKIEGKTADAEQNVRSHLEKVQNRIEQGKTKVTTAQAEAKVWLDEKKNMANDRVAEWKSKHEKSKLQNRADLTERYSTATIDVAAAAIDEAEKASLEAWLARQDANFAK